MHCCNAAYTPTRKSVMKKLLLPALLDKFVAPGATLPGPATAPGK